MSTDKLFGRIAIIGVGLIGGSIGMAVKRRRIAKEVIGIFRRRATLNAAIRRRAVERGTLNLAEGVSGADLVIVATPVGMALDRIEAAAEFVRRGAIIIDVGSTKEEIVREASRLVGRAAQIHFIGCHPLAGSEKVGVEFARPDLFEGAMCILTKTNSTDLAAFEQIENFWHALGSKTAVLSPEVHDELLASVSHLPRLVAVALVNSASQRSLEFAASGFKDTTRIAQGDAVMWRDVFLTNRKNIVAEIDNFVRGLEGLKEKITKGDGNGIVRELKKAQGIRECL